MNVIFLAYANSHIAPLEYLKEEAKTVYGLLWKKARDRDFIPFYEPFSSIDQISKMMLECTSNISVFSFSGHSGRDGIELERELALAGGIAAQLESSVVSNTLKLVLINGCSSVKQVKKMFDKRVPVVIATNSRIGDRTACVFASTFFKGICEREYTIKEAFDSAISVVRTYVDLDGEKKPRGLEYLNTLSSTEELWELFELYPGSSNVKIIPKLNRSLFGFRGNEKVLKTLYTSFYNAKNPKVVELWEKERKEKVEKSEKEATICNSIPRMIGFLLEKLLRFEIFAIGISNYDLGRLRQLCQLFQGINEFLAIIMISQLWEIVLYSKAKSSKIILPDNVKEVLVNYFKMPSSEKATYDYSQLVITLKNYLGSDFKDRKVDSFAKKQLTIDDFRSLEEEYEDVCRRLRQLNLRSLQDLDNEEILKLYQDGEDDICILFNKISFIHRYKLRSIQYIEALRKRHEKSAEYKHSAISLNQVCDESSEDMYGYILDSPGVIIELKYNGKKAVDFLNLSPFIIDLSSFEDRSSQCDLKIFDELRFNLKCTYKDMKNPIQKYEIDKNNAYMYEKVVSEFKCFIRDVLSSNLIEITNGCQKSFQIFKPL